MKKVIAYILSFILLMSATNNIFVYAQAPTKQQIQSQLISLLYKSDGVVTCDYDGYKSLSGKHEGIDLFKGYKVPIYAVLDGEITGNSVTQSGVTILAVYNSHYDVTVVYEHGIFSIDTTKVTKGIPIGVESNQGASTHTHLEIRKGRHSGGASNKNDTLENPDPYPIWSNILFNTPSEPENQPEQITPSYDKEVTPSHDSSIKFPAPIQCYTINETTLTTDYKSINSTKKGSINPRDLCTITGYYVHEGKTYVSVNYPGKKSDTAYAPLSAFAMGTRKTRDARVKKNETVYTRSNLSQSLGTVYKSDSIQIIYENGSVAQIIYPTSQGYKMGWISLSKFEGYSTSTAPSGSTSYKPVSTGVNLPIKTYAKTTGRVITYSSVGGAQTGWIDGAKDLCTIHEIYGNGWLKVSYPTSKGSKTAYAHASAFADNFSVRQSTIATSYTTVYRRSDMSQSIGTIYPNDKLQIVGNSGGLIQVVYPISGGYKMGWIGALATQRTLENINTIQKPNQQTYVQGQQLNSNGMGVNANYMGGFFRSLARKLGILEDSSDGYDLKNTKFNTVGTNTVAVIYEENGIMKTDSFNVEVIKRAITSISVTTLPHKTSYIEEQPFIKDGMVVSATYNDGTTEIITDYELFLPEMTPGTKTVYVEAEGMGTSFGISVRKKVLQEIKVSKLPNKISYIEGETIDTSGMIIEGHFDNGTIEKYTTDYTVDPQKLTTVGKQNVVVTYKDKEAVFTVDVIQKVPTSIEITTPPSKTEITEGTIDLDTKGLIVNVTYNDGTSKILEGGYTVYGYDLNKTGNQTVTVNFCGFTDTFQINVKQKQLTKLQIAQMPYITEYIEGESFNGFGIIVYGHYDNGDINEIFDYSVSGYDASVGTKTITVSYDGKTATFDVTVSPKTIEGLVIETMPQKTEYLEDESLDLTGLNVSAVYNNGDKETINLDQLEISGYENTPGIKGITVSYGEYSAVFDVTVKEMILTSFTLDSTPSKSEYKKGEELDLAGIKMTAKYEHGLIENANIDDCKISGFNKDIAGIQVVLVSYRGSNAAFVVNVKEITEQTAMIKAKNISASCGHTVAMPINIINNTGISDFELYINYDKKALTSSDISPSELLSDGDFKIDIVEETEEFITQKITYSQNTNMEKNGTIFTLYFTASDNAPVGNYPVEVTYNTENTKNAEGKEVKLSCVDGSIEIVEGETIPYVISGEQATVQSGGLLNYEISLANNVGLSSYKLKLLYDTSVLDIEAVKSGRLFGDFEINYTKIDGGIEISANSTELNKQNGSLLILEFIAAEGIENGTYPISISCTENGNNALIECEEGSVSVSGYVLGDLNGDGRVNNFDVMMHVGYLSNSQKLTPEQLLSADVTGDGNVDYLDYSSLSAYVVGIYEGLNSDTESMGSSLSYSSNFVGGANSERAIITASEIFDAQPGDYVTVDVDLSRNPGLSGYVVSMEYDKDALELIDINQKDALSGGKFNVNTSISGEITVMWSDIKTHKDNGTIFSITFKIGNNPSEELPLILTYNSEHTGYLDENYTSVPVTLMSEDGAIYINNEVGYMTIDEISNDGTDIKAQVSILNNENYEGIADLYIATYDKEGRLVSVKSQKASLSANKTTHEDISLPSKDAQTLKVFIFKENSIKPLLKSKTATF